MSAAAQTILPDPVTLLEDIKFLRHEVRNLRADVVYYQEIIRLLKHQRFAPKSEVAPSGQGTLFNEAEVLTLVPDEDDDASTAAADGRKDGKKKKRGRPVRAALPDDLPVEERIIDLPESEKTCPHGVLRKLIGFESLEQLGIKPAQFFKIIIKRLKYATCDCDQCLTAAESPTAVQSAQVITTAPAEPQPIPKSFASPGLLAQIVVNKYADALPLYRQEGIFKRYGIDLPRSTQAGWMISCGKLILPLINLAKEQLLLAPIIYADETRNQILKGTGKAATTKSYTWVFMRDDADGPKVIIYEVGPSRGHEVPLKFLEDYAGFLHTDGYEVYETLAEKMPGIKLIGDWVHARRKFHDVIKALPKDFKGEVKAQVALDLIDELFRIERDMDEITLDERKRIRQERSKPVTERLKAWADNTAPYVPPKGLTGKAIAYMLARWRKLTIFLDNPMLRLDTNGVENAIRPFVIGRKNWLFSDTLAGAESSAALYSLLVMAREHRLNPVEYMTAVFTELPKATTADEIEKLLPWNWQTAATV
jgi:transposase